MEHPFSSGASFLSRLAIEEPTVLSGRFWAELRTFLAVAKAKSLSRAAGEIGLSRMTASREIRRLQDAIGAQLVIFTKTGASLTPRGEKLALALQRLDQEIFALTSDLRTEALQTEGVVRLSVTDGIGIFYILPILADLTAKYPRIRVEFVAPRNYLSLVENRTDLMIGFSEETNSEITSSDIGTMHLIPFASRAYIEKNGMPSSSNLDRHYIVHSSKYYGKTDIWRPWKRIVDGGRRTHASDSSMLYGMMVRAGFGIGLLANIHAINSYLAPLDLNCDIKLPIHIIGLSERLQSKPVRIVYDFLLASLSEARFWLSPDFVIGAHDGDLERAYHMLLSS